MPHAPYYFPEAPINSEVGRRYLTATVTGNTISWQQAFLDSWDNTFTTLKNSQGNAGNVSGDSPTPPTITIGWGSSAVPGVGDGTRDPWTTNGDNPQGFVDPNEISVSLSGNASYYLPTSGSGSLVAEPTGQVYAGIVNGLSYTNYAYGTTSVPSGDESPYAPFDGKNLAISQTSLSLGSDFTNGGIGTYGVQSNPNLDYHGNGYLSNSLGQQVDWNGATFQLGPPGTNDVVTSEGQTIPVNLPSSGFSGIALLGAAVDGTQGGSIDVHYTDGTSATFFLDFSDWQNGYDNGGGGTVAPYEAIAETMPYIYATSLASPYEYATNSYLYAHYLPVTSGKTIKSITLASNSYIQILAIDLI